MKTSKALLLAVAALLSFSCAKENLKETESPASSDKGLVEMTFNAFADEETKTAIGSKGEDGKYPVNWVSADKIAVLDAEYNTYKFDFTSGEGTKATFSGKVPSEVKDFYAIYPYMEGVLCDESYFTYVSLPNDQTEFASNISCGVMVAHADADKNLKFKNVTAFIKITIPAGITQVSFEGANKEIITGQLSFQFDGTTVSEVSAEGPNATYAFFGDTETELKAGTYYLAVAPVALPDGFIVTYADINGVEKTEKGTKDPNLKPGEILDLGVRDPFKPVALTRGAAWEWTATNKTWAADGTQTIAQQDWNVSCEWSSTTTSYGYDTSSRLDRGQQFGSSNAKVTSVSLSSNYGETYGIDEIVVKAACASGSDAMLEISVGGKKFVCENKTSVALTTSATEYTFKNSGLVAGDIIIKYTQTATKAMYLKAIFINPIEKTQLATPANLKASIDETVKNKINVSWDAVENAGSYSVTCSGVDDPKEVTTTSTSFDNLDWSTDYTITVVAKVADGDAAHLDSDAAVSETISIGAGPILILSDESNTVEANATTASFNITSNLDWTVSKDEAAWITDWTKTGSKDGTVTIKFDANTAATARTATFTVKASDNAISKTYTLTQKAFGAAEPTTETFTFSQFTSAENVTFNSTNFTIKMSKGTSSSNKPAWVEPEARLYPSGSLTISSAKKISKITFNYNINKNKNGKVPTIGSVKGKTNAGTWNADSKTWSDTTGDTEITMSTSGSAGNLGFTSITVTFAE